mgnify:CR=1 FL=1
MNLKPFVNDKHLYDDFLEELDERIENSRKNLEQATTQEEMFRCQGDIRTLRKLKTLREKVNG